VKAVVVHEPGDIRYESVPLPIPGPGLARVLYMAQLVGMSMATMDRRRIKIIK
jgi:hypothetical protein